MSRHGSVYDRRDRPYENRRDRAADLAYSHEPAPPYPHTISMVDNDAQPMAFPAAPAYGYSPPPRDRQQPSDRQLDVPRSQNRPRSMPPADDQYRARGARGQRRRSGSGSDGSDSDRPHSPLGKARHFVNDNFSNSAAGLGVSVLGALMGGLAAREAVELTNKEGRRHHQDTNDYRRNQMIGTVVGAAVGALGANAFEKRLEDNRDRERRREESGDYPRWPSDRVVERREVVTRPRSRGDDSGRMDSRPRNRGNGVQRKVDNNGGSWESVKDWVYDDKKSGVAPSRHSDTSNHH